MIADRKREIRNNRDSIRGDFEVTDSLFLVCFVYSFFLICVSQGRIPSLDNEGLAAAGRCCRGGLRALIVSEAQCGPRSPTTPAGPSAPASPPQGRGGSREGEGTDEEEGRRVRAGSGREGEGE